jgi:AraC-like DNA-binding protein
MKKIPLYKFYKHKYGDELLVDVVNYDKMRSDICHTPVYSTSFYSIMLILEGNEEVGINGRMRQVCRGTVVCGIPGEVWTHESETKLEALNLIFDKEFLLSFFNDAHFLDHFAYLAADRTTPFLLLNDELFERVLSLYREMQKEINGRGQIDQHLLRAMLYETLMLLKRAEQPAQTPVEGKEDLMSSRYVSRFQQLLAEHYASEHSPEFYASQLCITSNYLNKIVRQSLGKSTKECILDQLFQEACLLLRYTTLSIQEIATRLGFETSTYFTRIFHRHIGMTPVVYREQWTKSPEK